jgi:predicted RNA binding protein YcfA (HicA-like mRNA interferase family)
MSKNDKLLKRFFSIPNDFSYQELCKLLSNLGFEEISNGKTSGSRVRFYSEKTQVTILLHKPHGSDSIGKGTLEDIYKHLKEGDILT